MSDHASVPLLSATSSRHNNRLDAQAWTSWAVIGAMTVLMILDRFGTDFDNTNQPALLAFSALIGSAAIALVLRTASRCPWQRITRRIRLCALLLVLTAAGMAAALAVRAFDVTVGLPIHDLGPYLFQRTGWVVVLLIFFGLGRTALAEHRRQVTHLAARKALLERTYAEVNYLLSTAVPAQLASIIGEVRAKLDELTNADAVTASQVLTHISDHIVRANSHALIAEPITYWGASPPAVKRVPRLGALVISFAADRPLRPAIPATLMTVWASTVLLPTAGLSRAIYAGLVAGALAVVSLLTGGLIIRLFSRWCSASSRALIVFATTIALSFGWVVGSARVSIWLGLAMPLGQTPWHTFAQAVIFASIPLCQLLIRAVATHANLVISELQRITIELEFHIARANATLWAQQRALARELHGPMQSVVTAAALRLTGSATNDALGPITVTHIKTSIETALLTIQQEQTTSLNQRVIDLEHAVSLIQGLWEGVCNIAFDCPPDSMVRLTADPFITDLLFHALNEACTNAIRHGHATTINAQVRINDCLIALDVTDNGTAENPRPPGGGSAFFDEVTLAWQRTHDPSGTRLSAQFSWS